MNVGSTDVLLYPHTVVGTLDEVGVVSLPAGVTEVPSTMATATSQSVSDSVPDQIDAVDLSPLPAAEQGKVKSLLTKYTSVFSAHDGDFWMTFLLSNATGVYLRQSMR